MEKRKMYRGVVSVLAMVLMTMLAGAVAVQAHGHHYRNYVIPTYYGYGVVPHPVSGVYPYIVTNPSRYNPAGLPVYYGGYAGYPGYAGNAYYPWPTGTPGAAGYHSGYGGYSLGEITCESLRVRSSASKEGGVLGTVVMNERVWVLGQTGDWYLIQASSGLRGYAHGSYINLIAGGQQGTGRPPMSGYYPYYIGGYGYAAYNPFAAGYDPPRGNWRQFYWWW